MHVCVCQEEGEGTNGTAGATLGVGALDVGGDARELGLGVGEELAARGELGVRDAEAVAVVLDDDDSLGEVLQVRVRVRDALQQLLARRHVLGAAGALCQQLLPARVRVPDAAHALLNLPVATCM